MAACASVRVAIRPSAAPIRATSRRASVSPQRSRRCPRLTIVGTQELTFAQERDTQDTFFGARAEPWNGAQLDTGVTQRLSENAERMFATVGLSQAFQINEALSVDFGFNREQTLEDAVLPQAGQNQPNDRDSDPNDGDLLVQDPNGQFPARPPASGAAPDSDFTSGFFGASWRQETWEATGRIEHRNADTEDQSNFRLGFARQLDEGRIYSVTSNLLMSDGATEESYTGDIRFALAWRPQSGAWTFLDRLDLVASQRTGLAPRHLRAQAGQQLRGELQAECAQPAVAAVRCQVRAHGDRRPELLVDQHPVRQRVSL